MQDQMLINHLLTNVFRLLKKLMPHFIPLKQGKKKEQVLGPAPLVDYFPQLCLIFFHNSMNIQQRLHKLLQFVDRKLRSRVTKSF